MTTKLHELPYSTRGQCLVATVLRENINFQCPGCSKMLLLERNYDPDNIDEAEIECGHCDWSERYKSDEFSTTYLNVNNHVKILTWK